MKGKDVERSLLNRILGIILISSISVSAIHWFVTDIHQLVTDIFEQANLIVFNKGAMYSLGAGLGMGLMTILLVVDAMKKKLSSKVHKIATSILLIFFGVFIVLPQAMDYVVHQHMERISYVHCEEQSHQWLHAHTYVFATDLATCTTYRNKDLDKSGENKIDNSD